MRYPVQRQLALDFISPVQFEKIAAQQASRSPRKRSKSSLVSFRPAPRDAYGSGSPPSGFRKADGQHGEHLSLGSGGARCIISQIKSSPEVDPSHGTRLSGRSIVFAWMKDKALQKSLRSAMSIVENDPCMRPKVGASLHKTISELNNTVPDILNADPSPLTHSIAFVPDPLE